MERVSTRSTRADPILPDRKRFRFGGVQDASAVVGAVGIGARDEGMPLVRLLEQGHRAIAVLYIGRMDQYDKGATIGIDHCMAFASHGLLACVVTTRTACFGGLQAMAVDDCHGW